MNKKLKNILIGVLLAIIVFIAFAFGSWEINPGKWDVDARSGAAFTMAFVLIMPPIIGLLAEGLE